MSVVAAEPLSPPGAAAGLALPSERWLRALALVSTGKEEEAIELLNDLISRAPSPLSYAARGRAFCNLHFTT